MIVLKIGLVKADTSESSPWNREGKTLAHERLICPGERNPTSALLRWISIWRTTEDALVYWHLLLHRKNRHTLQSLVFLWLSCWACKNRMFKSCPIWWHAVYCSDDWLQALAGFHFLLWVGLWLKLASIVEMGRRKQVPVKGESAKGLLFITWI